ncbi:MAG: hypothetical protein IKX80_06200, partial [Lachnospiraceae bacterium]|nr:hypothetical protein [Lachnospiraceae bacterium]
YEYVETGYEWEITEIIKRYEEYARASGRIFMLVLVLQSDHLYPLSSIRRISENGSIDIAFTSVSEWYSGSTGGIIKILKVA